MSNSFYSTVKEVASKWVLDSLRDDQIDHSLTLDLMIRYPVCGKKINLMVPIGDVARQTLVSSERDRGDHSLEFHSYIWLSHDLNTYCIDNPFFCSNYAMLARNL